MKGFFLFCFFQEVEEKDPGTSTPQHFLPSLSDETMQSILDPTLFPGQQTEVRMVSCQHLLLVKGRKRRDTFKHLSFSFFEVFLNFVS